MKPISIELISEATVYNPYAISKRFTTNEMAISILNNSISAIIKESQLEELINGNYTLFDKITTLAADTERIEAELNHQVSVFDGEITSVNNKISGIYLDIDSFRAEVSETYATMNSLGELEGTMSSRYSSLELDVNGFKTTVSNTYATKNDLSTEVTSLQSSINQMADKIELKVSQGQISSLLSMESGQVTISSNRFVLDSTHTKITADGTLTCSSLISTNAMITGGTINISTNTGESGDESAGTLSLIQLNRSTTYTRENGYAFLAVSTSSKLNTLINPWGLYVRSGTTDADSTRVASVSSEATSKGGFFGAFTPSGIQVAAMAHNSDGYGGTVSLRRANGNASASLVTGSSYSYLHLYDSSAVLKNAIYSGHYYAYSSGSGSQRAYVSSDRFTTLASNGNYTSRIYATSSGAGVVQLATGSGTTRAQVGTTGMVFYNSSGTSQSQYNNTSAYVNGTLNVSGTVFMSSTVTMAKKIQAGSISITPSAANTPTYATFTFGVAFSSTPRVVVTPVSTVPGTTVTGVGVSNVSTTSCRVYVTRTNKTATTLHVVAIAP